MSLAPIFIVIGKAIGVLIQIAFIPFEEIIKILTTLLKPFISIFESLIPLFDALSPLIKIFAELLKPLLPILFPMIGILQLLTPYIVAFAEGLKALITPLTTAISLINSATGGGGSGGGNFISNAINSVGSFVGSLFNFGAEGGTVTSPTIVGEKGKEEIIPLDSRSIVVEKLEDVAYYQAQTLVEIKRMNARSQRQRGIKRGVYG